MSEKQKSLRDRALAHVEPTETNTFLAQVMQRMGRPIYDAEADRQQRQANDTRLLTRFLPNNNAEVINAAKDAIEHWLASLNPARLLQPFFIDEIKLAAAHVLAARGFKNTMLPPVVLSKALVQLGFVKGRLHGTARPQTRFWLHPAAQAAKPTKRNNNK